MSKIKLTQNQYALVDDEDFEYLNKLKWYFSSNGYAIRRAYLKGSGRKNQKSTTILMHRIINNTPKGILTDHINGNKLDNRKKNLRICTKSQNGFNRNLNKNNTSGVRGVCWHNARGKWIARICFNKKQIHLGCYDTLDKADLVYKKRAGELFGEFATIDRRGVLL